MFFVQVCSSGETSLGRHARVPSHTGLAAAPVRCEGSDDLLQLPWLAPRACTPRGQHPAAILALFGGQGIPAARAVTRPTEVGEA